MMLQTKGKMFPILLEINGSEGWLQPLYSQFDSIQQPLAGTLSIEKVPMTDAYRVIGSLTFTPMQGCGRCGEALAWPLATTVDATFLKEDRHAAAKEATLDADDLEIYTMSAEGIDIYQLLLDSVYQELPLNFMLDIDSDIKCLNCEKLDQEQPLSTQPESKTARPNPFSVLKRLKIE